jgi:hypothetical protein
MCAQWNRVYESRPWRALFGSKFKTSGEAHFRFDHPSALIMLWQDFPELLAGWPGPNICILGMFLSLYVFNGRDSPPSHGLQVHNTTCWSMQDVTAFDASKSIMLKHLKDPAFESDFQPQDPAVWKLLCGLAWPECRRSDLSRYGGTWRTMFIQRPRVRTDGMYALK